MSYALNRVLRHVKFKRLYAGIYFLRQVVTGANVS